MDSIERLRSETLLHCCMINNCIVCRVGVGGVKSPVQIQARRATVLTVLSWFSGTVLETSLPLLCVNHGSLFTY
jgi:hypothetical protein